MNEIKCPKCGEIFTVDESGYAAILAQVRDSEFNKELEKRKIEIEKATLMQSQLEQQETLKQFEIERIDSQAKISQLELEIKALKTSTKAELEKQKAEIELKTKDRLSELEKQKDLIIADKEDELERLKTHKLALSVKDLGEDFEQWCYQEFQKIKQSGGFPNATFEKDNDSSDGSKGDFIFKDFNDDLEFISIMFEMKTEREVSANKKKNNDHFKKLDEDRNKKNCDFAVLVSTLEEENEFYNQGIVQVFEYENMYVVRPQFMIQIISILRGAALKSIEYKNQIIALKQQNFEVEAFNTEWNDFKDKFGKNYESARDHYTKAIDEIDKTIAKLEKIKSELTTSGNQLRLANDKVQSLTGRKLAKNSPQLKEEFKRLEVDEK